MSNRHQLGPASHSRSAESWQQGQRASRYRCSTETPPAMKNRNDKAGSPSSETSLLQNCQDDVPNVHVVQVHNCYGDSHSASDCSNIYETVADVEDSKPDVSPGYSTVITSEPNNEQYLEPTDVTVERTAENAVTDNLYETCIIPTLPGSVNHFEVAGHSNAPGGDTGDIANAQDGSTHPTGGKFESVKDDSSHGC